MSATFYFPRAVQATVVRTQHHQSGANRKWVFVRLLIREPIGFGHYGSLAMKRRLILFGMLMSCLAVLPQLGAQNGKGAKEQKEPEKTDITAEVREMNSDKFAWPPTEFRVGHVNP